MLSTLVNIPEAVARPLDISDNAALTSLVREVEVHAFGSSITNEAENLGFLQAPELHGGAGTVGLWSGHRLIAAVLAADGLEHHRELWFDMFLSPHLTAARRQEFVRVLYQAGIEYGRSLATTRAQIKTDAFAGDTDVVAVLTELGFEQHRTYWRMMADLSVTRPSPLPQGYSIRTFDRSQSDWRNVHDVINTAFLDHYDFHPEPFEVFAKAWEAPTVDMSRWRIVESDGQAVALGIASLRYAEHGIGYIDTLAVLREHRGRGIARCLLTDAFAAYRADGFTGVALHCDSTNPTGATALYESVGMTVDQEYWAFQRDL